LFDITIVQGLFSLEYVGRITPLSWGQPDQNSDFCASLLRRLAYLMLLIFSSPSRELSRRICSDLCQGLSTQNYEACAPKISWVSQPSDFCIPISRRKKCRDNSKTSGISSFGSPLASVR